MKKTEPGLIRRALHWLGFERRSTAYGTQNSGRDFWGLLNGGTKSKAGTAVTEDSTLAIPAFWCGFNVICDSFQMMPLELYKRDAAGDRERASEDPRYKMMKTKPNAEMNPGVFKRLACGRMIVPGQFFAEIERTGGGRPVAMHPIHPSRVEMFRKKDGSIWYRVRNDNNTHVEIPDEDMFRPFRYTLDGINGVSVIDKMKESLGLTIAANEYGSKFFGGNAMPSHLITLENSPDEEHIKEFKRKWLAEFNNDKSGGVGVIGDAEGVVIKDLTHNNEVSQFLETRQYQSGVEIARHFPINPIKIFDMGKATWGNFTEVQDDYLGTSVMPFCIAFEEECDRKLLTERERETMYFEFNIDGALRAQIKARFDAFVKAFQSGFSNLDEIRQQINRNKLPDGLGKDFYIPANLVKVGAKPEPSPTAPATEPAKEPAAAETDTEKDKRADASPDLIAAFGPMFTAAGGRLGRIEADKAGRSSKKADTYLAWCEEFIVDHRERVRAELTPVVVAYLAANKRTADALTVDRLITEYMDTLKPALRTADPAVIAARPMDWVLERLKPQEN